MNISIKQRYEKLVKRMVESGEFASDEEVVEAGLRLLEESERKLEALRHDIQEGLNSGPGTPIDEHTVERIVARGRERLTRDQTPE